MKSSVQMSKTPASSSASTSKYRKNSKDREKRKSQTDTGNHNSNDKGSPSKESSCRSYAGIGSDSLCVYAEQTTFEHLSEEICDLLTEDANYKIRYIIQDALVKARLSGRNSVIGTDIEESFANLRLDPVYGAPANPNWVPFGDQNLYYLDDTKINLYELAKKEITYIQPGDTIVTRKWYPEQKEVSSPLKKYFSSMCLAIVDKDDELRSFALKDLSENPQAGPIIEWFYRFGYFLLTKDITYDCLTLYALDLIETLENSILGRMNVSEKQLKLLVRLLLQRLLKSVITPEVLKQMCAVLALLCERSPLKELVFTKIQQKMPQICIDCALPVITIVNCLGLDAIEAIFIPNMNYFLTRIMEPKEPDLTYSILGTYNILCANGYEDLLTHESFREVFGSTVVMFWRYPSMKLEESPDKLETNLVAVKKDLAKSLRKFEWNKKRKLYNIEDIFDIEDRKYRLRNKIALANLSQRYVGYVNETKVTIGKTSILLNELKQKKRNKIRCFDHSLLLYNL